MSTEKPVQKLSLKRTGIYEVSMFGGSRGIERLGIKNGTQLYPALPSSGRLFEGFALMHLVAPYLPRVIEADFPVLEEVRKVIRTMYGFYSRKQPKFIVPKAKIEHNFRFNHHDLDALVAYSGGKDSMWNMAWARDRYGVNRVAGVHIHGLNRANAYDEWKAVCLQSHRIGFPLIHLDLLNSSRAKGYEVMRSRDIFLTGILIPVALKHGAKRIIIEGFAEESKSEPFTGRAETMDWFNELLSTLGVPVEISWRNAPEIDIVADLYEQHPDWMPLVCNCFSPNHYKIQHRRFWNANFKDVFPLYESQCGLCVKCRIINLVRLTRDRSIAPSQGARVRFLNSMLDWVQTRGLKTHRDMIEGSFLQELNRVVAETLRTAV